MQCAKPIRLYNVDRALYPEGLVVGCGKCKLCRKKKKSEWALRLIQEMDYHTESSFVTFTYSDEFLPKNGSLRKDHIQLYYKKLRRAIEPKKIKHYTCGEYGDRYGRPHYHSIIFGESDRDIISSKWGYGHVDVGSVSIKSIRYVAGYIDKKFDGELEKEIYTDRGKESVFKLQSNGFGKDYLLENYEQIKDSGVITVMGVPISIPRYYLKLIEKNFPEEMPNIRERIRNDTLERQRYKNEDLIGHHATDDEMKLLWDTKVMDTEAYYKFLDMQRAEREQRKRNLEQKLNLKKRGKL